MYFYSFFLIIGMKDYCERYGETIYQTVQNFGPNPKWHGEVFDKISADLEKIIPLDKLTERRQWRDNRLISLAKLKKDMAEKKE